MRYILFLLFFVIFSCKSADDLYKKGDYMGAYQKALKKLEKDKDVSANKTILNRSLAKLLAQLELSHSKANTQNNLEKLRDYYISSVKITDNAHNGIEFLSDENENKIKAETSRQEETRKYLLDENTKIAEVLLNDARTNRDKKAAQNALEILTSNGKLYGYYDKERMEDAAKLGMMYYNFNVDHGFNTWYSSMMDSQFDDIVTEGDVISTVTFRQRNDNMDCDVLVRFDRLDENRRYQDNNQNYSERIQDGFDISRDTSGREIKTPRFKNVNATVTERKEILTYTFNIRCDVSNVTKFCDWRDFTFTVDEESIISEFSYNGDERAIPQHIQDQMRQNQRHKRKDDIIETLVREAYDRVRQNYLR